MVSVVSVVGLLVIIGVNTAVAALMTRFFRVRLDTRWGPVVFALAIEPVVLTVLVLLLSGVLGLGGNLGSAALVFGVTVILPMALGVAFDYFWMPAPDDVDLPAEYRKTGD
jgi:hypothetical protein